MVGQRKATVRLGLNGLDRVALSLFRSPNRRSIRNKHMLANAKAGMLTIKLPNRVGDDKV